MKSSNLPLISALVAAAVLLVVCDNVKAQVNLKGFILGETPGQDQWQPKTPPHEQQVSHPEPQYRTAHRPQVLHASAPARTVSDRPPVSNEREPEGMALRWGAPKTASRIPAATEDAAEVNPTAFVTRPNTRARVVSTVVQTDPEMVETPPGRVFQGAASPDRILPDEAYMFDEPELLDDYVIEPGCTSCGDDACADCGGYGGNGYVYGGSCDPCGMCFERLRSAWWARDLSLFAGMHGFKGPIDRGLNGNFGLHEGINYGGPIGGVAPVGYQVGFAAVHSNFSGDQVNGARRGDRDQFFLTAGLFRRAPCGGWQWGVAFDLMRDVYYERFDLTQIRAELGHVSLDATREIGFFGAFGAGNDNVFLDAQTQLDLKPTDMFAFYYRRHLGDSRDGRFWVGFTGEGDALLGADLHAPIGGGWVLENRINYLIPRQGRGPQGQVEESWGLNIQLVWYIGQPARSALKSPFRPMFDVADNATFMVDASRR